MPKNFSEQYTPFEGGFTADGEFVEESKIIRRVPSQVETVLADRNIWEISGVESLIEVG